MAVGSATELAIARRIAVLDDDSDLREELCEMLEGEGHSAVGLSDPEGIAAARPDILLLDLAMPGVDGVDVIGRLARLPRSP